MTSPTDPHRSGGDEPAYELAPPARAPRLPGTVVARGGEHELRDALLADVFAHAINCVRSFGDFQMAVSGSAGLAPLYLQMMYDPAVRGMPWGKTHLWLADERVAPFDAEESSYRLVRETLVDHSGIPPAQFHPMFPLAEDAASRYETELRETLGWREKGHDRLDCVVLELGAGGGVAGLAPGSPSAAGLVARLGERLTMTMSMINAARLVAVLVPNEGAAREAVERLERGEAATRELPAAGIKPLAGELRWYIEG